MKTTLKIGIAIIAFAFICGKGKDPFNLTSKVIEQSVSKISDSLYAGKYEVSNQMYRFFIDDLKKNNKLDELKTANVDTLNWKSPQEYNEPYVEYYFRHEAYNNYPVVNVSHEGANTFCKWLTNRYNNNPKRKYKKVLFRLPDTTEWTIAAQGGMVQPPYPWGGPFLINNKGQFLCNFRHLGEENVEFDTLTHKIICSQTIAELSEFTITYPIDAFYPNGFGLYNISGNVAEMVQEKGIAKGGGWKSYGYDVRIEGIMKYTKPQCDIGFRYFMEIIEK